MVNFGFWKCLYLLFQQILIVFKLWHNCLQWLNKKNPVDSREWAWPWHVKMEFSYCRSKHQTPLILAAYREESAWLSHISSDRCDYMSPQHLLEYIWALTAASVQTTRSLTLTEGLTKTDSSTLECPAGI